MSLHEKHSGVNFLFTSNANYPSPTTSLSDTDLQNIYDAVTIQY